MSLKLKSARCFKTYRFETESLSKHHVSSTASHFPPIAFKRCYGASLYLDFELNRSSDPLAESAELTCRYPKGYNN